MLLLGIGVSLLLVAKYQSPLKASMRLVIGTVPFVVRCGEGNAN